MAKAGGLGGDGGLEGIDFSKFGSGPGGPGAELPEDEDEDLPSEDEDMPALEGGEGKTKAAENTEEGKNKAEPANAGIEEIE